MTETRHWQKGSTPLALAEASGGGPKCATAQGRDILGSKSTHSALEEVLRMTPERGRPALDVEGRWVPAPWYVGVRIGEAGHPGPGGRGTAEWPYLIGALTMVITAECSGVMNALWSPALPGASTWVKRWAMAVVLNWVWGLGSE